MKIKICGLFRQCDIKYVNEYKPDYIGFVFAKSKRQVSFDEALFYKSLLHPSIKAVGVFVNEEISVLQTVVKKNIIDIVQLHGNENKGYLSSLKNVLPHTQIIKAVPILDKTPDISEYAQADALLFDSSKAGSGNCFDWKKRPSTKQKFFLAGGINLKNLPEAIALNPYAIDISSGAEVNGFKDENTIKNLIQKVHNEK